MSKVLDGVAASLTSLRLEAKIIATVTVHAYTTETCVSVTWQSLARPVLLEVGGCIYSLRDQIVKVGTGAGRDIYNPKDTSAMAALASK